MTNGHLESGSGGEPWPSCARRACPASPGAPASSVRWAAGAWIRLRMGSWTPCSRKLWRQRREAGAAEPGNLATGQIGKANEK
ncbi:MAG: hypothetical protein H6Q85_2684 [candidate division NC10 bacterium]|nr:hypothetical protein [candidate division NC10 bacterium]